MYFLCKLVFFIDQKNEESKSRKCTCFKISKAVNIKEHKTFLTKKIRSGSFWCYHAIHIFFEEAHEVYIKYTLGAIAFMYIFKQF